MDEARPRFIEAAEIIQRALAQDSFEYNGQFFQIPRTAIRPRPISHPERRFYGSAVSPDSTEVMAKLGFAMLVIMQNEWPKAAADVHRFNELAVAHGHPPRPPIILTNVSCAESRAEAQERALEYLGRKWDSIDSHYKFSDGHLASVKGYESYEKTGITYAKMKDPGRRAKATEFYVSIQIVGTPDDCLQKISDLHRLTGLDHLITEFSFGGLPHEQAELSMRLFADKVLPVLQRDAMFAPTEPASTQPASEGVFAPA